MGLRVFEAAFDAALRVSCTRREADDLACRDLYLRR